MQDWRRGLVASPGTKRKGVKGYSITAKGSGFETWFGWDPLSYGAAILYAQDTCPYHEPLPVKGGIEAAGACVCSCVHALIHIGHALVHKGHVS